MSISDIYGLRVAFDNIKEDHTMLDRHAAVAVATRKAIQEAGLTLYQESGFANTVTVFEVPDGVVAEDILEGMKTKHNILLAGSFGEFAGKVIRIGHMGTNATMSNMLETLVALEEVLSSLGVSLQTNMTETFLREWKKVQ